MRPELAPVLAPELPAALPGGEPGQSEPVPPRPVLTVASREVLPPQPKPSEEDA